jgi:N-formylglutamate amidohydrolase
MRLPILLSVPHAGTKIPDELRSIAEISDRDIVEDGDEQAAEIFLPLRELVEHIVTTEIARAFVDLNRARDDLRKDGVIKTHTCWDVPIYASPPDGELITRLLERYYDPYHERLRALAASGDARVGIDCHTMVAYGPPVGPDPGRPRPAACVSDADGACERGWAESLAAQLAQTLGGEVRINDPFTGGYITREHAAGLPWLQLEISRGDFLPVKKKASAVREALTVWARRVFDIATS